MPFIVFFPNCRIIFLYPFLFGGMVVGLAITFAVFFLDQIIVFVMEADDLIAEWVDLYIRLIVCVDRFPPVVFLVGFCGLPSWLVVFVGNCILIGIDFTVQATIPVIVIGERRVRGLRRRSR